jgi:hypothetical protein
MAMRCAHVSLLTLICAAGLLIGCGSIPTVKEGFSDPQPQLAAVETGQVQPVLVSINYPARVDETAERWCAIGGTNTGCPIGLSAAQRQGIDLHANPDPYVGELLSKSVYHAIELKAALEQRLPPNSVILTPERVWAEGSTIYQAPLVAPPPHVLRVRLWMRADIARVGGVDGYGWDTFGSEAAPAISIARALPSLSSEIDRLLAGTSYEETTIPLSAAGKAFYVPTAQSKPLVQRMTNRRPVQKNRYLRFQQGYRIPRGEYDNKLAAQIQSGVKTTPADSPYRELWAYHANCIVEALNCLDVSHELAGSMTEAARAYDQSLKISASAGTFSSTNDDAAALIAEFFQAEREFVNEQDREFGASIYSGTFGQTLRETLKAERAIEDGVNRARDRQNQMALMGALVSTASTAMAMSGKITPTQNLTNQLNVMQLNAAAVNSADAEVRELLAAFEHHLGRTREAQFEYVIHANGREIVVRAKSLAELRKEFKRIYDESFPVTASR